MCIKLTLLSSIISMHSFSTLMNHTYISIYYIGNEAFAKLINNSSQQKSRTLPLTIFEIIESKSLPSLYSILALALHNVRIGNVEDHILNDNSSSEKAVDEGVVNPTDKKGGGPDRTTSETTSASHLSITLPCKSFPNSSTRYNITVSLYIVWYRLADEQL